MVGPSSHIGLLRSATKHPVRLVWTITVLAVVSAGWIGQLGMSGSLSGWLPFLSEICRIGGGAFGADKIAAAFVLWATMSLTMMLPSALPMIVTYLDIAEAARGRDKPVAPAALLIAGYSGAWLSFAMGAAILQSVVNLTPALALADRRHGAILLLAAGAYQFAPVKHACLSKCRSPMAYFLANWSDRPVAVFRMGMEQGVFCLICCWALMLLMFTAGLMNLGWMAGLTLLVALEKTLPRPKPLIYGSGAGLICGGLFGLMGS
jgi:predicted metal-binding membrane protein